jgi:hypothetical protein
MGNRTAKFISALIGSIIAGVPLAAVSQNAPSAPGAASTANAENECLASPKGVAPQGQHWHYRVERGTKRQCWYLRAEGAKAATSVQTASSTPQPASPQPQSVQNARAEYITPQSDTAQIAQPTAAPPATQPASATSSEPQQPSVTARWPDTTTAAAPPAPQPTAAPATASAQPTAAPAPMALAAADAPAEKPTGSLQMLLLVIGAALALAGLIASIIYRFAGGRARVQTTDRRVNWDNRQDHHDARAPWLTEPVPAPRVERPRPIDFDAVPPQPLQLAEFADDIRRIAAQAPATRVDTAEPDEAQIELFDGEFEIVAPAPQLAVSDVHHEEPAAHDDETRDEVTVDIDIITAMLERLAAEGPQLMRPSFEPSLEADLAALARSSRGQSAARA